MSDATGLGDSEPEAQEVEEREARALAEEVMRAVGESVEKLPLADEAVGRRGVEEGLREALLHRLRAALRVMVTLAEVDLEALALAVPPCWEKERLAEGVLVELFLLLAVMCAMLGVAAVEGEAPLVMVTEMQRVAEKV